MEIKIGGKTSFENLLKQLFHSPLLDKVIITNSRYALVGLNHFISNSGSWNNCYLFIRHDPSKCSRFVPASDTSIHCQQVPIRSTENLKKPYQYFTFNNHVDYLLSIRCWTTSQICLQCLLPQSVQIPHWNAHLLQLSYAYVSDQVPWKMKFIFRYVLYSPRSLYWQTEVISGTLLLKYTDQSVLPVETKF